MNFSNVPSGILLDTYWNTYWKDQSIYITGLDSSQKPILLHFTSSGTWINDPRFRSAGYLTLPANLAGGLFSGGISEFQDGSYFVNGTAANGSSFLIKYGSTGTVQNSFGSGGVIYGPTGYYLWANPSSSSSNGNILVQGNNGQDGSYYLAQYTSAGVPDTNFGSRGILTLPNPPAGGTNFIMTGIPVSDWRDGSFWIPGQYTDSNGSPVGVLLRYDYAGKLDTQVGLGGVGYVVAPSGVILNQGVSKLDDGSYIAQGQTSDGANGVLVHYSSDWQLDVGFGTAGVVMLGTSGDYWSSVTQAANGNILVNSYVWINGVKNFTIAEYSGTGQLNQNFGSNGTLMAPNGIIITGWPSTMWEDGSFYVAGLKMEGSTNVILHYLPDGQIDTSFGNSGWLPAPQKGVTLVSLAAHLSDGSQLIQGSYDSDGSVTLFRYVQGTNGTWTVDSNFAKGLSLPSGYFISAYQLSNGKIQIQADQTSTGYMSYIMAQLLPPSGSASSDGALDKSFGTGGILTPPSGITITSWINTLGDGSLAATGRNAKGGTFQLRFTVNGKLDTSFANVGYVTAPSGVSFEQGFLEKLLDGSYLLSGHTTDETKTGVLYHYLSNGKIDSTFGTSGRITGQSGYTLQAIEVSGNKLQVLGTIGDGTGNFPTRITYSQYTAGGQLDTSFGDNGSGSLVAPDGFYLQGGTGNSRGEDGFVGFANDGKGTIIAGHYFSDGKRDMTFGGTGSVDVTGLVGSRQVAFTDFTTMQNGDMAVSIQGELSYSVVYFSPSVSGFNLAQGLNHSGLIDLSELIPPPGINALSTNNSPILLDDGSFLVQGITNSGPLALIHYKPDGSVDQTFAEGVGFITVEADITSLRGVEFCNGEIGIIGSKSGDFSTIDYGKMFFKNGVPDTAFGINGSLVAPLGSFFSGIIPQADGSLLASTFNSSGAITVLHYTPQGQITQGGPGYIAPNGCDIIAIGSSANNSLLGGVGEDSLVGGGGNETLSSGSGDDTLAPGAGNDSINGGTGTDCADYKKATVAINVNLQSGRESGLGNDTLTSIEKACTGTGADILAGGFRVANVLSSGAGNDTLYGAASGDTVGDTLEGGAGTNTYVVYSTLDTIVDRGTNSVIRSSVGYDLSSNLNGGVGNTNGVNNLVYTGSNIATLLGNSNANRIDASVAAGAVSLNGGSARDTLIGSTLNDTIQGNGFSSLSGGAGNDLYILNAAGDRIVDSGGANTILSRVFTNLASTLVSGVNNLDYTGSAATLLGNAKANRIDATQATGTVSIAGGVGADTVIGGGYSDTLVGNGSSSLAGGAGINTYSLNSARDRINNAGGDTTSVIRSTVGYDLSSTLNGGVGNAKGVNNLVYTGTAGAVLKGNSAANSIMGGAGSDTVQGWSGTAASNTASDTLTGGARADNFILSVMGQTTNAYGNGSGAVAHITDFQGGSTGDKLVLHNFGTGHAGSAGYQTLSGGTGILDVYTYQGTDPNHLVAHITLASGTFAWASNASFV